MTTTLLTDQLISSPKVVLTEGRNGAPARLVVSVDLGLAFVALPVPERLAAIERGLVEALDMAGEHAARL